MEGIPAIIHCCWFGGGRKSGLARRCLESWRRFAPDFAVREWDEKSVRAEFAGEDATFFETALAAKAWAAASDWARMAVLWRFGGIYFDFDLELVSPLCGLPEKGWIATEWMRDGSERCNPGGGIALPPRSPVARGMLDFYAGKRYSRDLDMMWIISRELAPLLAANPSVATLPPEFFCPIDVDGTMRTTERTVGIHHCTMSWASPQRKIARWLSWHGMLPLVDAILRVKRAARGRPAEKNRYVMASVWEEHCCECAMPTCFGTCGMFERGWHGRCLRIDGFKESVLGKGRMHFRRWAKVEAMWHGTFVRESTASIIGTINGWIRPVFRVLGPIHRAVRWRIVALLGHRGAPSVWHICARSVRDEHLVASIAAEDGRELFRAPLKLTAGRESAFEFAVPHVRDRTLFRIFPADGEETGEIEILENAVMPGASHERFVKCLVWDLDGTLWEGTLSEVGVDGCVPRPESVALIKELDVRGIVNSVASRNDAAEAMAALRRFGLEEYFVFPHVGWGAKSDAIRALAREMNISEEAIAFVDDRSEQRAEVAANIPGVRTYAAENIDTLSELDEFNPPVNTESTSRRLRYREEMSRRKAQAASCCDSEEFAAVSAFAFEFLPVEGETATRCLELLNRTNQLNISGRRYNADEFSVLLSSCDAKAVRAHDAYGDYGTVGFVAMKGSRIVEMCFSCRAAKKGLERKVLFALAKGERLKADVVRTGRNSEILSILKEFT